MDIITKNIMVLWVIVLQFGVVGGIMVDEVGCVTWTIIMVMIGIVFEVGIDSEVNLNTISFETDYMVIWQRVVILGNYFMTKGLVRDVPRKVEANSSLSMADSITLVVDSN